MTLCRSYGAFFPRERFLQRGRIDFPLRSRNGRKHWPEPCYVVGETGPKYYSKYYSMPKTRIWSRTKNGLRCHLGSGIWHINARVNGRVITPTTTRTAERYDAEVIKNQRIAAAKLPNAAEQAAIIKAGFTFQPFIEEYLRHVDAMPDSPTRDRKTNEVTYLRRRWAAFRNVPWAEVEKTPGEPRPLSPPSPLDLEDPRKLTVLDL